MMQAFEFIRIFQPLEVTYGALTDEKRDVFYEIFKQRDPYVLRRAIDDVLRSYQGRQFPNPAVIEEAYLNVGRYMRRSSVNFADCPYCQNIGLTIPPASEDDKARGYHTGRTTTCTCEWGQMMKVGWAKRSKIDASFFKEKVKNKKGESYL